MRKYILILMLCEPLIFAAQTPGGAQSAPVPAAATPKSKQPMRDWLGQHDDVAHFYGSFFINEFAYQIQGLAFPKWKPSRKILIASAFTLAMISAKERWDMSKSHPTGWSWDDWLIGCWAIPIYIIVRVCLNDFRQSNAIYVDPIDPQIRKRTKAPRKWSLKRQGFLN